MSYSEKFTNILKHSVFVTSGYIWNLSRLNFSKSQNSVKSLLIGHLKYPIPDVVWFLSGSADKKN
jgi:hypothetical protein